MAQQRQRPLATVPADALDPEAIQSHLSTTRLGLGRAVLVFRSTSSTNDVAWEYSRNIAHDGLCVFAEEQTAGRGRGHNRWLAPPGESILCSVLLMDCPIHVELLTLAAGLATANAVRRHTHLAARIKWPNDVLVHDKKAAGVLIESRRRGARYDCVVGIGVNCRQDGLFFQSGGFAYPATSLDLETRRRCNRNRLAATLLNELDRCIAVALSDPSALVDDWQRLSSQLGRHLVVETHGRRFAGVCVGIDPTRGLILQLHSGAVRMFPAAHTTIVKQHG